ncbi:hypothetical protein A2627_03955 [Candidatus Woesebacteria bacterium RIFCSPHIGHO2_01_FULL_39_28]|uniref:Cohesin domain-containing protein n=1 Tax=Candidatus Woesebacteria bacterium RIFCSPHIGHO2_01_FULL_39_28 TaxID=1802496 RepID=A0A1F7YFQ1_9BACT|nr:MAG: hypothetical protein A2627_03955 [Candidatus Woesebacteria bacterium RIFCSPHIGHO2_01_FULL_39_28]OGM57244.1 MAG: hypothetical protein A3A50_00515 [Candidatus Woesebacteria bacterium RIFCSPLOWO2_01_FULL_38_20]
MFKQGSPVKKIAVVAFLVILLVGIGVGIYLVSQRQNVVNEASVAGGEARVSLTPSSGTYQIGQSFPVTVNFTTGSVAISAIAIRISYAYAGTSPEVSASDIQVSSLLLQSGDWSCPVKTVTPINGQVQIDLACVNLSTSGYLATTDTALAAFTMTVNQTPSTNPVVLRFDPSQSIITKKTDAQDTLLTPASTASFTIGGVGANVPSSTPTPSPTPTTSQTGSNTPTPTGVPTATPTSSGSSSSSTSTLTPTVTTTPVIPVSGISTPTLLALGVGFLLIVGSLFLAL